MVSGHVSLGYAIVFGLCDLILTLVGLAAVGKKFAFGNIGYWLAKASPTQYDFRENPIDFFFLMLLRVIVSMTGGLLPGKERLVTGLVLLLWAFSPTKLLALSESPHRLTVGVWICLIWNILAASLMYILCTRIYRTVQSRRQSIVSTDTGSRVSLLPPAAADDQYAHDEDENVVVKARRTFELIGRILQYCKQEWMWHVSGFTWLFIYSLSRVFVPYYTGKVVATVAATQSYDKLMEAVKIMIVISFVSAVCGGFRGGSFEYAYARISRAIRNDLFASLVEQEIGFYDANKTGEVTSRLTADTQTMSDTVALNVNVFLRNIVMLSGSLIFMFVLSWRLSLVTFIAIPVVVLASKIFGSYYDMLSERTQNSIAKSNDVAEEVLSTMRTVRSFACEQFEAQRYHHFLTVTLSIVRLKAYAYVGFIWVNELFQMLILVAVLWYGGHLVITNRMKAELLVSFLLYQIQLGENLRQMGEVWTGLMQSVGASRKVFEYIDRQPTLENRGTASPSSLAGKIEFRSVQFSYPTRPDLAILRKLSFTVNAGETVALVGPSGGGKSSCIALLERFYEPTSGQILVDGILLRDFEHKYIHTKIALVGQEPVLFARSIRENIAYGLDVFTEFDIVESAKMANAHNFIMDTTDGYKTNVGEKGGQMSGGQKQRIAIARALVRRPAVLLLDEATSALDTESEHLVQEAIYRNLQGRSVILIAHRLSTVEKADRIVVINRGQVEQEGTHLQLLQQQDGLYKHLVQRQMIGYGEEETEMMGEEELEEEREPVERKSTQSGTTTARSLLATSFKTAGSDFQTH